MMINVLTRGWQSISSTRVVVAALSIFVAGVVGYYAYHSISTSREQRAYKAFAESHDFFEQALATDAGKDAEKNGKLWRDVEVAFKTGYEQNSRSNLAPYFLAFQAEALVHQGDLKRAIEIMDQMIGSLKKDSPLFGLYAVKRSLMKLDMSDQEIRKIGLEELINLASEDAVNPHRDMALYYLGEYYWAHDESKKAYVAWKYLEDVAHQGKSPTPSPWFDLVKSRVEGVA